MYILGFFWVLHPISMSVCVPPNKPTGNAVTPAGGPTVPLGSGTVYPETASDPPRAHRSLHISGDHT